MAGPSAPPSLFAGLREDELYKIRFNIEAEVNRLVKENPGLGLLPVESGSLEMDELKGYLGHINDQIGNKQQWQWFDIGLEGTYNFIAYVMEKMGVPMKHYFDKLKTRIVDYRQLIMKDPAAREMVEKVIPMMTSSENKGVGTVVLVMLGQVLIGCIAAFVNSYNSKTAMFSNTGAAVASDQLDNYMFGKGSLFDVVMGVGKSIFTEKPPARPEGVKVDV